MILSISVGTDTFSEKLGIYINTHFSNTLITLPCRRGQVLGWIALSPVSARDAYKGVAEVSIYVDTQFTGKGIGSTLMEKMILSSEEHGIWTLFSSVFPENMATLKLHEKFGFRIIGDREKIAKLDGKWRNTLILERRSKKTGFE